MRAKRPTLSLLASAAVVPDEEPGWDNGISPGERRRSPRIWLMAQTAAQRVCARCPQPPQSIITATALGALDETRAFLEKVFTENLGSPRNFIASVHNSMGGKLALDLGVRGPNLTICDGHNSLASALVSAGLLLKDQLPALVVVVDENIALLEQLQPHFSGPCRESLRAGWHDGAAALLIGNRDGSGVSISADGPRYTKPVSSCAQAARLLALDHDPSMHMLDITETNASFLSPAMALHRLFEHKTTGRHLVPSYCPTSGAVALVCVTI